MYFERNAKIEVLKTKVKILFLKENYSEFKGAASFQMNTSGEISFSNNKNQNYKEFVFLKDKGKVKKITSKSKFGTKIKGVIDAKHFTKNKKTNKSPETPRIARDRFFTPNIFSTRVLLVDFYERKDLEDFFQFFLKFKESKMIKPRKSQKLEYFFKEEVKEWSKEDVIRWIHFIFEMSYLENPSLQRDERNGRKVINSSTEERICEVVENENINGKNLFDMAKREFSIDHSQDEFRLPLSEFLNKRLKLTEFLHKHGVKSLGLQSNFMREAKTFEKNGKLDQNRSKIIKKIIINHKEEKFPFFSYLDSLSNEDEISNNIFTILFKNENNDNLLNFVSLEGSFFSQELKSYSNFSFILGNLLLEWKENSFVVISDSSSKLFNLYGKITKMGKIEIQKANISVFCKKLAKEIVKCNADMGFSPNDSKETSLLSPKQFCFNLLKTLEFESFNYVKFD